MPDRDESSVDAVIAEALAERLAGREPDLEAIISSHPENAVEIRERLADLDNLSQLWRDISIGAKSAGTFNSVAAGSILGEFEILREIGRGGMGVVYLARQQSLGRNVALKVIPVAAALSEQTRKRFLREAEALASISHASIVPVFTAGEDGGFLFIAMEHVEGPSLAEIVRTAKCRPSGQKASAAWKAAVAANQAGNGQARSGEQCEDRAGLELDREYVQLCCSMAIGVAGALQAAHQKGVIHRDVKPANILIDRTGRAKIPDFGLAAINTEPHLTASGEFFGTPNYVSPEQACGQRDRIDARTDVYSLSATLYECLTFAPPFDAPSTPEVLTKLVRDDPMPARKANPSVARDLNTVLMKGLAKTQEDRYASAGELAEDLQRFLDYAPIRARPATISQRIVKTVRRRPVHAVLAAVLLMLAIAAPLVYRQARVRSASAMKALQEKDIADKRAFGMRMLNLGNGYMFGPYLVDGMHLSRDQSKAIECYRAAAEAGNSDAMHELAKAYLVGAGVQEDSEASEQWVERGALAGNVRCMTMYGAHLLNSPRPQDGIAWLEKAASSGDVQAMDWLGQACLWPRRIAPDHAKGVRWLLLAANSKDPKESGASEAMYCLGLAYCQGLGVGADHLVAKSWFERAAKAGEPRAMVALSQMYHDGQSLPKDPVVARKWLTAAAETGDLSSIEILAVQLLVEREYEAARPWLIRAADMGSAQALYMLGSASLQGWGCPKDEKAALGYLLQAAEKGYAEAMASIGLMYSVGMGCTADAGKGAAFLRQAADKGSVTALAWLGESYELGRGIAKDVEKALDLYRSAAEKGSPLGMQFLARCYADGVGVPVDTNAAELWYRRAADKGDAVSAVELNRLVERNAATRPTASAPTP